MAKSSINRRLNLVLEVGADDAPSVFVHHVPVSREVFELNYLLFTEALARLYKRGVDNISFGSRILYLTLQDVARDMGPDVLEGAKSDLFPEIWRLTNVLMPDGQQLPFDEVLRNGSMEEDDIAEVQNFICFFTVASWVHTRSERDKVIYPILKRSGQQLTALNCTDFQRSLQTSILAAATAQKAPPSSIAI